MNIERLLADCKKYSVVSFDMFDTLVKRNVYKPSDIFSHVQQIWNNSFPYKLPDDYVQKRIRAYEKAERIGRGICNISDIYEYCDIKQEIKKQLIELEIRTEISSCFPNIPIVRMMKKLKNMGKRVVVVSDMYLDSDVLKKMLLKCGIEESLDYDALFVSCDIKKRKTDGDLYQYVLEQLNVPKHNVIHIGDNWKSDFLRAIQQGIRAIHIPTWENHLNYYKPCAFRGEELAQCKAFHAISNNLVLEKEDEFYKIGVEAFGPFMTGFLLWLHSQFKKEKIEKVFFLAREGKIMMECYQMLFPNEKHRISYMYASRRSIVIPSYAVDSSYENICKSIAPSRNLRIQDFFFRINLDIRDYYALLESLSIPLDYTYDGYEMLSNEKLAQLYSHLQNEVARVARKEYSTLVEYLYQIGFSGKKVAIVDIGWNGGMQKALEKLPYLQERGIELHGYYAGINSKMLGTDLKNAHGYIYEKGKNENYRYYIYGFAGPLEMALTAAEGSVKCFKKEENGDVVPVLLPSEYAGKEGEVTRELKSILSIQAGVRRFVMKYADINPFSDGHISEKVAFASLCRFGTNPKRRHLLLYKDFGAVDLNAEQNMIGSDYVHLCGAKSIFRGLALSTWKIGFMKYVFRVPLPYKDIYRILRKRVN